MREVSFFAVTVDHLPDYLDEFEIVRVLTQWGSDKSANAAFNRLADWAKENDYDGIIGLRFESYTIIDTPGVGQVIGHTKFLAYGTLVRLGYKSPQE